MSKRGKKSLMRDERGLSTVEYTVLLVLIVAGAVGIWRGFGDAVTEKVTQSTTKISELKIPE